MHRHAFEAFDRSCKDVMRLIDKSFEKKPFGNKAIALKEDFRQVLPVVVKGTDSEIINACLNQSNLWSSFNVLKLTINMRVKQLCGQNAETEAKFIDYLLSVGEGKEEFVMDNQNNNDLIKSPLDLICNDSHEELINCTYPNLL
jgi:ATP-dependent DNA helicase PIF1